MKLFLIGYMGCGKSSLGRRLARRLAVDFVDMDKAIEAEAAMTIPQIFATEGEEAFRQRERDMITKLGTEKGDRIIATGGGAPCREGNLELLNSFGSTIYLKLPPEILVTRLCRHKEKRPLIAGKTDEEVAEFVSRSLAERETYYQRASIVIDCAGRSDDYIVEHLYNFMRYNK